jgi:hypothetical protein
LALHPIDFLKKSAKTFKIGIAFFGRAWPDVVFLFCLIKKERKKSRKNEASGALFPIPRNPLKVRS